MSFHADDLREVTILRGLSDEALDWFAVNGDRIRLERGQRMFERGEPANFMFIVVSGSIDGYEDVGGQDLLVATTRAGQVTGMLPYSRMTHYPRYTVATEDTNILRIRKSDFPAMLAISLEVGQRLVAAMSERVRGDVRLEQQQERMAALGRLSAGLAHELNNPAAAVSRAVASLADELTGLQDLVVDLVRHDVNAEHIDAMNDLRRLSVERVTGDVPPLARADREDRLGEWLEDRDVPRAWDVAATLADAGLAPDDLDAFAERMPGPLLADALVWIACGLGARRLVDDIASAAGRISDLVGSVKTYSHMDRSPEHKPTDVREGLDNTLRMLGHKLGGRQIRLERDYHADRLLVEANAGELNQVWTNLVDNAIDAVEDGGRVRVETRADGDHVLVSVIDDGPGIPDEIREHIFEPFFTTKGVGLGTGLGLDIARRIVQTHRGHISVESNPGRTAMHVRLPKLG